MYVDIHKADAHASAPQADSARFVAFLADVARNSVTASNLAKGRWYDRPSTLMLFYTVERWRLRIHFY